jgi:hypothetical protein
MSKLKIQGNASGTGTTTVQSANTSSNTTFTLPGTDGSANQFLQTDGSGNLTFATGLTSGGALGTPSSGTLTNCTGLPVSGVSGLGSNVATFLATPSSANLAAALTDETGTGANVFANTPTLVTPILGTPTSGTLSNCTVDGTNKVGYINAPQSTNTTLALTDQGKHVYFTGGSTATLSVPTNASVAFPTGTTILVVNNNSGNLTIQNATSGVTFQLANGATGNRTVATKGMATLLYVGSDTWYVSGAGVT